MFNVQSCKLTSNLVQGIGMSVLSGTLSECQYNVGLGLMTLRSRPEPRSSLMLNQLSHLGAPSLLFLNLTFVFFYLTKKFLPNFFFSKISSMFNFVLGITLVFKIHLNLFLDFSSFFIFPSLKLSSLEIL